MPSVLLIVSESVFPTASQTCSLWGAAKENELQKCKEDLLSADEEKISCASSRIAKVVCMEFNCDEVVSLIQKLCENIGAMDLQHDKAAVTWIGTFLQMRVKELDDKVAEILGAILVHLPVVDHLEVQRLLIEGILLLAHYHQEMVLTSLLRQPLPMQSHLKEVWLAVAENMPFARTMLSGLMGRLQSRFSPRAKATSKADIWRLAAVDPLMTLCTMCLLIEKMDKDDKLQDLFPDLIYTLLMQLSCSHRPEATSPILKTWRLVHTGTLPEELNLQRVTIKSMQLLFKRLNSEGLVLALEEQSVWARLESSTTFLEGVGLLARWDPGSPLLHRSPRERHCLVDPCPGPSIPAFRPRKWRHEARGKRGLSKATHVGLQQAWMGSPSPGPRPFPCYKSR